MTIPARTKALVRRRGGIGLVDGRLDVDRREAALPVERLDRGHAGTELRLEKELARLERHERRHLAGRHRLRPGDLGGTGDAILTAAGHVEHDRERRLRRLPADGDLGLPVALLAKIVLDPRFGVLEQILVDRTLPFDRRELLETIRGHRVATLKVEAHAHRQTRPDGDDQIDGPAILGLDRLEACPRLRRTGAP